MEACRKHGIVEKEVGQIYCPECEGILEKVVFQSNDEIIVKMVDKLSCYHIGCGSYVDKNQTSSGKPVLTCRKCMLRVVVNTD